MGFFDKITGGLKKTREAVAGSLGGMLRGFTKIDRDLLDELEEILIMSDVGTVTAALIRENLEKTVKERGITDPQAVRELLCELVADMLRGGQELKLETKPAVILMIGVNGVGKTTTCVNLAAAVKAARYIRRDFVRQPACVYGHGYDHRVGVIKAILFAACGGRGKVYILNVRVKLPFQRICNGARGKPAASRGAEVYGIYFALGMAHLASASTCFRLRAS